MRDLLSDMVLGKNEGTVYSNDFKSFDFATLQVQEISMKPSKDKYNSAMVAEEELNWIDLEAVSKESDEETKVASFLSCMARQQTNKAKMVKEFEDYYFTQKPKFSGKLVKVLLVVGYFLFLTFREKANLDSMGLCSC